MNSTARTVKQFARIADELKADPSWVLWRYERRPEKPEKPTKVLRQANGRHADSTNPATWTTFDAAVEAFERGGWQDSGLARSRS